jgi:ABC-2 type transport system ATP-binding protein
MSDVILKTENLRVEFRSDELGEDTKLALRGLDLSVHQGEVFGFLGPNGAGKTTTMNVLLGFVNPTKGDAWLFGVNVRDPIARQRIGYLPELTYYYKFLSAEEILRFYAKIFRIPKAEVERRIDSVLKLVELEHARKRQIKTYSKGMQQRVGLAQALINNPDLLILDEPTSGLDPAGRDKMLGLIRNLARQKGVSVVVSTHILSDIEACCDAALILARGRLLVYDSIANLQRSVDPGCEVRCDGDAARLGQALAAAGARCEVLGPGELRVAGDDEPGERVLAAARHCGVVVRAIVRSRTSLEDTFLRAVRQQGGDDGANGANAKKPDGEAG